MDSLGIDQIQINKVPADTEYYDVMNGSHRWEVKVHDHGKVALVDSMPRLAPVGQTADFAIVQAARVSYGAGTKKVTEDKGLIRYLYRHQHTSPFEMIEFKFHCVMPVFIARQWIRHRTANVNEYSARYSVMPDKFYHPSAEDVRKQSTSNRQGGEDATDTKTAQEFLDYLDQVEANYKTYSELLDKGVSRELARIGLPVSVYTEWYWKIDLHNLFHFLRLRMDSHSQKEIRDYANTIFALIRPIVPVACEAFIDYAFESIKLTRLEIEAIRSGKPLNTANKRETEEWEAKRKQLGLPEPVKVEQTQPSSTEQA
ncbi:thymidylate synthase [Heterostelium album PN500]|uniref:Thymidylate synthase n=1 Tax=Heterostelium pallidum (strain ATCC 26659 / Pp 5 / PN500) TaxID=670386 RepID=D3BLB0_HETP5|nr:thymidylate synthase [Heterostelium album PN500]EFA77844.1 thymidylate synthase [Heterostelium album PN500]|eukprot:XP_020429972.1 thymidylate synthase [Heterostelium album PN500]